MTTPDEPVEGLRSSILHSCNPWEQNKGSPLVLLVEVKEEGSQKWANMAHYYRPPYRLPPPGIHSPLTGISTFKSCYNPPISPSSPRHCALAPGHICCPLL